MKSFLLSCFRALFFLGALGISLLAAGAALGFASPALDMLNHLQPLLFCGTLVALLLAQAIFHLHKWQTLTTAIAATGFLASAVIVVPEAISAFVPQSTASPDGSTRYKLMTHNVFGNNFGMEQVAQAIFAEDPDIVALQEYFSGQRRLLHPLLIDRYPHFQICTGGKRQNLAIYAKMPFEMVGPDVCGDDNGRTAHITARFTDPSGTSFSVVTTHLDWPMQISKLDDGATPAEGLALAFARQQGQFAELEKVIDGLSGPLVLAGDFNSTSWSFTLRNFVRKSGMDRHTRSLFTFPKLWYIRGWRPTPAILPLDQVMSRGGVLVYNVHAGEAAGSDHKSVTVVFSVEPERSENAAQ